MAGLASYFTFFVLSHLLILHSAQEDNNKSIHTCPNSFTCGKLGPMKFPFANVPNCGLCMVNCRDEQHPKVQLETNGTWFNLMGLPQPDTVLIQDQDLGRSLHSGNCDAFKTNITLPNSPSISFTIWSNITLFKCNKNHPLPPEIIPDFPFLRHCEGYDVYYKHPDPDAQGGTTDIHPPGCPVIQLPIKTPDSNDADFWNMSKWLTADFQVELHVTEECLDCHNRHGHCRKDSNNEFHCSKGKSHLKVLILGTVIPGVAVILICLFIFIFWRRSKWNHIRAYFLTRNTSSDPSKADLEGGSVFFGVPVFSYAELEEATNNFDETKELGDGGFGTVYFGKLRDGREVAVKRLYEHNYKRVEQFMNEIEILTRLRHKNLVSLYGCTSRHSRELLLVYEYIPNGTVADHLHGVKAEAGSLTWPIRMKIAIETASALAYLHASEIIHRDVKTNNILLDNNFCVKVADFGLSRLFPMDVTHVSTAPQGTPGYVDPEYHQCYQLTNKSDVYSFGVVLVELISSMPAVDISRHRHEINLANLAINRIQKSAFNELIDPCLGFESDPTVTRMTTTVAELAFRCLQLEKEMRPNMEEVLEVLMEIQGEDYQFEKTEEANDNDNDNVGMLKSVRPPPSPEPEDVGLLKNIKLPSSPDSVTDKWVSSRSTTPSASA